jgi:uncharacterized damage-inducible protein DinB
MHRRLWFDRTFEPGTPLEAFPEILERIRGTGLRLRERVSQASSELLTPRHEGRWSIQEHVGHLVDLEALWAGRMEDFDRGEATLRPADLENRATWEGGHNERELADLLLEFDSHRSALIERCEAMGEEELARTALHPRLRQPMSVVDLLFFVAEHDDHHLASISELLRRSG